MTLLRAFAFSLFAASLVHAAPGFKQKVSFPAFESWARQAAVAGHAFAGAKDEPEAFSAQFKGPETLLVKIEGAGKFEGLAGDAKPTQGTWKGRPTIHFVTGAGSTLAVRFSDSKATFSITTPGTRTAKDLEKILDAMSPLKILK